MKFPFKRPKIFTKTVAKGSIFSFLGFSSFTFIMSGLLSPFLISSFDLTSVFITSVLVGIVSSFIAAGLLIFDNIEDKQNYDKYQPILMSLIDNISSDDCYFDTEDKQVIRYENSNKITFEFSLKSDSSKIPFGQLTYDKNTETFSHKIYPFFQEYLKDESELFIDSIKSFGFPSNLNNISDEITEDEVEPSPYGKEVTRLRKNIREMKRIITKKEVEDFHKLTSIEKDLNNILNSFSQLNEKNQIEHKDEFLKIISLLQEQMSSLQLKQEEKKMKNFSYHQQTILEKL